MFDSLAKSMFEQIVGSPQDKDRAQEQLKPVLERRLQPCLELWKDLWPLAADLQKRQKRGESLLTDDDIHRLCQRVDSFMHECGALISVTFFAALAKFQVALRDMDPDDDETLRKAKVVKLCNQLFPSRERDDEGEVVQNPGLFMLLRDEIGSNARAASSALE